MSFLDQLEFILAFGGFILFIGLGLFVGGWNERRHYDSIRRREQEMSDMLVTDLRSMPFSFAQGAPSLVIAEVAIGSDYLKSFLSSLRKIFGGEMKSYLTLADRARREAKLRIMEQARRQGYNAVANVRYYSADVGGNASGAGKMPLVTVIACGTAYHARG
jgi:uncharacterized protein YbjQ (UPF0145 family)